MDAATPTLFAEPAAGPRTATATFRYLPPQSGAMAPERTLRSRALSCVPATAMPQARPRLSGTFRYIPVHFR